MAKSEWQGMCCSTPRDKAAIKSWFAPCCDDMDPVSCDVLCDIDTDRSKKVRATMLRKDGTRVLATRTTGRKTFSIHLKPERASRENTHTVQRMRMEKSSEKVA
jgi:hypothetical protein